MSSELHLHSRIDSIHVHVDGGGTKAAVEKIVDSLRAEGFAGTTTSIIARAGGPQRTDDPFITTYDNHTPGEGKEALEFFSTTLLADNLDGLSSVTVPLRKILTMLSSEPGIGKGIVVEVERVIGKGEAEIQWTTNEIDESLDIRSPDVGFMRKKGTAPVEIHYAFEIPKSGEWKDKHPIDLQELTTLCRDKGIRIGGWFLFEEDDQWSYRSNQFAWFDKKGIAHSQREKLAEVLLDLGFESKPRSLVEQILGVWRTPLVPVDSESVKSVQQLAAWECCSSELQQFWVFTPNFLGDTRGEVREAMIHNLKNRVRYTYFLRSFADILRLRKFADSLQRQLGNWPQVSNLIDAVLLDSAKNGSADVFDGEYFIANPNTSQQQGYRLMRDRKGVIRSGERMPRSDFERLKTLAVFYQQKAIVNWLRTPLDFHADVSKLKAVVCVMLGIVLPSGKKLSERDWEAAWNEFDQMVAAIASRHWGLVAKGSIDSHFVVFEDVTHALEFAQNIQQRVREYNKQILLDIPPPRVAIDYGHVTRNLRSYGFDFNGHPLAVCSKLVDWVSDGQVLLTKAVQNSIPPDVREHWRINKDIPTTLDELGSVDCAELDWQ
jgi:hypothetical protein